LKNKNLDYVWDFLGDGRKLETLRAGANGGEGGEGGLGDIRVGAKI